MIDKKEQILYVCIFGVFLAAFLIAMTFPAQAAAYPKMICGAGMALSLALSVKALRKNRKIGGKKEETSGEETGSTALTGEELRRIALFLGLLLLYIILITVAGYFVSTTIFLISGMAVMKGKFSFLYVIVSIVFVLLIFLVFGQILHILIPRGFLF